MKEKKVVIFGAGKFGHQAIDIYKDRILFFVDNNVLLHGTEISGFKVRPIEALKEIEDVSVVIASRHYDVMVEQLRNMGIYDYEYFSGDKRAYYNTPKLVYNPYEDEIEDEETKEVRKLQSIQTIDKRVEELYSSNPLFDHVEIETINRCNGKCSFCPVNIYSDSREYMIMTDELYKKIMGELHEIGYSGKLALFSNNEPFLDPQLIDRLKYARDLLPKARMHLFTNGSVLTVEKFKRAIEFLDELIIDNYDQNLILTPANQKIYDYCDNHIELMKKVTIVLRREDEVLTSRGGFAPNCKKDDGMRMVKCVLPFKQLIIRPDGEVSLCCNDPLGKTSMGNVGKASIVDIWNGKKFVMAREQIYKAGRGALSSCIYCDTLNLQ